ncbi:MAG: alcohol dehydrogenase catalytic domain-containing protein [Acidobacteria bacterium]|nr:alcohol dehydrogenase catalytic domain-containing protein [Acidobacteriota bacterium]
MKAAFLTGLRTLEVRETLEPQLRGPRDVLLRVGAVGVCGSDIHYYKTGRIGPATVEFPHIVGHECAGTVIATGPESRRFTPGQRVAIDPLVTCGECDQCRQHRSHTCRNQRFLGVPGQLGGSLVEYLVMPEESCYAIPDSMTLEQAVVIEPLSIGLYAQRMSQLEPGARLAILGAGPMGLCTLLACRAAADCTAYVTDLLQERLQLATQLGANWTGSPRAADVVKATRAAEPLGVDFVFECAGEQETVEQGVELLKPGGTLLIVGIPEQDRISFPIHTLRRKELTIKNVRRQNDCIADAIGMVAAGRVNIDPLMTHRFSLAESQAAFDLVAGYRDGVIKALIHVSGS